MSYILSALKKAARERELGKVPSLSSSAAEDAPPAKPNRYGTMGFAVGIGALVIVNAALFMSLDDAPAPGGAGVSEYGGADRGGAMVAPPATPTPPRAARRAPAAPSGARSAPALVEVQDAAFPAMQSAPAEAEAAWPAATEAGEPVSYIDLPAEVRELLPELHLSGHVFVSSQPERSRVIINGRSLRAGQAVDGGVRIDEITADKVVFSLDGRRFQMATSLF